MPFPALRDVDQDGRLFYMSAYAHAGDYYGLTLACRTQEGEVWAKAMDDPELRVFKEEHVKTLGWPSFWKALNSAFSKGEPPRAIAAVGGKKRLDIPLKSSKDPQTITMPVLLDPMGTDAAVTHAHFVEPFLVMYRRRKTRKCAGEEGQKVIPEAEHEQREGRLNLCLADKRAQEAVADKRLPLVEPLRTEAQTAQKEQQESVAEVDKIARQVRKLQKGANDLHHLDGLYKEGGARHFQHSSWSSPHEPCNLEGDDVALKMMAVLQEDSNPAKLLSGPNDPELQRLLETTPESKVPGVLRVLQNLDQWDYNAFEMDELTDGCALLYTAWALHHKYGHVKAFGIDPVVLQAFWTEVSRGYHPNPYHNATHAADVLQITHYILAPGEMTKLVHLTKEDELAALLAAGIHDYDHPGLNNNFHSRTGEYLAILYNDRSVLENHHCACIFEMMQQPQYDILASFDEEQKKDIRETVVEMLLGTDMGNHAKIFSGFRRRLQEATDWHTRKDDVRLALTMAIKMADISNCGRPTDIYLRWAENIAAEFYHQGDAEMAQRLTVSPFMDRRKHNPEFRSGQISFMNYIVIPLFEACVQLLPALEFTVPLCHKNREHWQVSMRDPSRE